MNAPRGLWLTGLTALALGWVAIAGCGGGVVTSFHVTVTNPGKPVINQLYVAGVVDGGMQAFLPAVRPEVASTAVLRTTETVRILLPDSLAGNPVLLGVVGLFNSTPVSVSTATAVVVKGQEVAVAVTLVPMPCPSGTRQDPESKLCVCDRASCTGCCKFNEKREAVCISYLSPTYCENDRCVTAKECNCGSSGQCKEGQRCEGNACKCDEKSCDGCCSLGVCVGRTGDDGNQGVLACGNSGAKCDGCGPGGGPCSANGICSNNPVLCPSVSGQPIQCKSGTHCESLAFPRCGDDKACISCDPRRSDRCDTRGQCACGSSNAACGQVNGVDTICSNSRCIPPP